MCELNKARGETRICKTEANIDTRTYTLTDKTGKDRKMLKRGEQRIKFTWNIGLVAIFDQESVKAAIKRMIFNWADGQFYERTFYPLIIKIFAWIFPTLGFEPRTIKIRSQHVTTEPSE